MRNVRLLVSETHRTNKPLELGRPSREIGSDKSRLGNHALPGLLVDLLSRLDHLEHLLLSDTAHLGQWHSELGRLLSTLVLDLSTESLGAGGLRTVKQIGRHGVGGILLGRGALDVALLVCLDLLAKLDLLVVPLLSVKLGPQATKVLCILARLVAFTGSLLPCPLLVVKAATMLLDGALDVFVLRLFDRNVCLALCFRSMNNARVLADLP